MVAAALRRVPPVAWQGLRFIVVGVANTATTFATIWLLRTQFDASVGLASAGGYLVGMIQGFLLNRFWTFAGKDHVSSMAVQVGGFILVNLICGSIFTWANVALHKSMSLPVSSVLATALVVPLSFVLNRIVFREHKA